MARNADAGCGMMYGRNVGCCNEDHLVDRYEVGLLQKLAEKDTQIALRDANTFTDQKQLEMLKERMHAEIGDAKMYLEAAKAMHGKKDTSAELAEGFSAMAKDEYTHAKFMYMYMMENGIEISQECRYNLKALEEEMEATFR